MVWFFWGTGWGGGVGGGKGYAVTCQTLLMLRCNTAVSSWYAATCLLSLARRSWCYAATLQSLHDTLQHVSCHLPDALDATLQHVSCHLPDALDATLQHVSCHLPDALDATLQHVSCLLPDVLDATLQHVSWTAWAVLHVACRMSTRLLRKIPVFLRLGIPIHLKLCRSFRAV